MTTFTVAIPTHDRRETVVLAVRSALRQTRSPEEIIVTCDGCTDGTEEALRALGDDRIVVIELAKGAGYAYGHRNVALERATGEAIVWLADDDLLLPDHLERLDERWGLGDVDLVTTPAIVVAPDDGLEWAGRDWSVPYFRSAFERANTNVMASVSVRTELVRSIGGWNATIERWADWDLWKRALAAGARPAALDDPSVLHFKATGRVQAWPDRVRQNTEWLERISDPVSLRALRPALRRTRSLLDAPLAEHHAYLTRHAEETAAWLEQRERLIVQLDADVADRDAMIRERETTIIERNATVEQQQRTIEAHAQRLADAVAEIDRQRRTLTAIYDGGWWRLRGALRSGAGRLLRRP
ncbi:MAG: glycosyltransferase family 2 protein [Patulibacter sp.]